jgi:hypothetical protein
MLDRPTHTDEVRQHVITIEKCAEILLAVGWKAWAKNREEQQLLAQALIELRAFVATSKRAPPSIFAAQAALPSTATREP